MLRPRSSLKVAVAVASLLVSLGSIWAQTGGRSEVATGPVYNGVEAAIDLPTNLHVKNFGAPKDGQGLCVFASLTMAARWEGTEALFDMIHKIPNGGGWPDKVDHYLKLLAPDVPYVQYEGAIPRSSTGHRDGPPAVRHVRLRRVLLDADDRPHGPPGAPGRQAGRDHRQQ
jgi:hypothetical protein